MSERDIFLAALDLPHDERAAFLAAKCGTDADLRRRVEALFAALAAAGNFLAAPDGTHTFLDADPTADPDGTRPAGPDAEAAGRVIGGRYRLVERIGEGGMGSVWLAEQTEPVRRKVAVKLIKPGTDTKAVLARFEAERQALALMNHEHIAKVYDGGVDGGRPYFVMELVKGVPITRFCDERRLTPRQRLELFIPVCQALQHAHQKGVIHRDVKPANVLVALYDDRPVPKVIDFGVAKATGAALTEHTLNTGFGAVVGTPAYMSPEQATFNNLDIDTRSDVYSLGVLLYELLAGSPPFATAELKRRGLLEMLRVVREEEPPRPSTRLSTADALPSLAASRGTEPGKLTGLLRNELDWVVMKALEKDRTRRYESANGFAADVQRYLAGEPVQAHPPTAAYRLTKFVRKHRVQVTAGAVVLLALVLGLTGTTFGLIRADEKRRDAEEARKDEADQRRVAEANGQAARESAEKAIAAQKQAKAALDNADKLLRIQEQFRPRGGERYTEDQLATLNGLATQFEGVIRNGTRPEAAEAYGRLATVHLLLNRPDEQKRSLERAIDLWAELVRSDPTNAAEYTVQLARLRGRVAQHFLANYQAPNATSFASTDPKYIALLRQVVADWTAAAEADPTNATALAERALALQNVAANLPGLHGYPTTLPPDAKAEVDSLYREAVRCLERAVRLQPDDRPLRHRLQDAYGYAEMQAERLRAAAAAAVRFPDERAPRRWRIDDFSDLFSRDEHTWDSELFLALVPPQQQGIFPLELHGKPCEQEALADLERARAVLREFPDYKYATGVELMFALREAQAAGAVWWRPTKLSERPPPLTADQRRRRDALFARALAMARDPATRLPTAFLKVVPFEKGSQYDDRPPKKLAPLTAEEYVWVVRLGNGWATDDAAVNQLTAELDRRKDWRPTAMFQYFLTYHLLPEDVAFNAATPKPRLIDGWVKADAAFARFRASCTPGEEGYQIAAFSFSGVAHTCGLQFRRMGEPGFAKRAFDRCIQLLEEITPEPGVADWPYRSRCYMDRGDWHLDQGDWANALADYRGCLKHSKQKPGVQDYVSMAGMNATAHFRSGIALLRLNKPDEAEAAFDEALKYRRAETWQARPLPSGKPSVPWTAVVTERDRADQYLLAGRCKQAVEWGAKALKTLDENAEAYPVAQANRLRYALRGIRAGAYMGMNSPKAAVAEWEAGRPLATAEELRGFAVLSAGAYAKAGRHEEAARRLDDLAKTDQPSIEELYNLACGYSLCSAGAKVDREQADRYREQAMRHLRRAVDAGYADPGHMKQDSDFDPIREREDFKALLAELEKKHPPKK